MIYTVTLNPAIDYVMHPLTLDMGFTNRSSSEEIHCGGNGINVSTLLNELGVSNVAFGIAAGFTGDYLISRLQEKGVTFIGFSANKNGESDCVYGSVEMDWPNVYPTIVNNVLSGNWKGMTEIGVAEGVFKVDYTDQCTDEVKAAVEAAVQEEPICMRNCSHRAGSAL